MIQFKIIRVVDGREISGSALITESDMELINDSIEAFRKFSTTSAESFACDVLQDRLLAVL